MIRPPPSPTRTATLFPYPTLFRSDEVGGRFLADFLVPQILEIRPAFEHMLQPMLAQVLVLDQFDIARPIGPEGQLAAILPRKIEQNRQHLRGQLDRDR